MTYIADIFKGTMTDSLVNFEAIDGDTPIKAAKKIFPNARRAKQWENPDLILTKVWKNSDGYIKHGNRYCYMEG